MLSVRLQGVKRSKNSTINNANSGSGRIPELLTRGFNYSDFTRKTLVFGKVVANGRWSHTVRFYSRQGRCVS